MFTFIENIALGFWIAKNNGKHIDAFKNQLVGKIIDFDYNSKHGCIWSDLFLEFRTIRYKRYRK